MAPSHRPTLTALTLALALAGACVPAHAAPTAEEKAARKKAREDKAARKQAEQKADKQTDKQTDKQKNRKTADAPGSAPSPAPSPDDAVRRSKLAPPAAPTGGPALPPCPPDNTLTWRSFGAGFLRTWCTGCHSSHVPADQRQDAPENVNFDTHALYKPVERLVYDRAVLEAHKLSLDPASASPMPPAGVPGEADRRRLAQWIACGSPLP